MLNVLLDSCVSEDYILTPETMPETRPLGRVIFSAIPFNQN